MKDMFQCFTYLLVITSLNNLFAQEPFEQLTKKTKDLRRPIKVGMSIDEVKKTIGNPDAITPGFPDASYLSDNYAIETAFPESNGQLNYSTWLYYKKTITVPFTYNEDDKYFINGTEVKKELYEAYVESSPDTIYVKVKASGDTSIVSLSVAEIMLDVKKYFINDQMVGKELYDDYFNYSRDTFYTKGSSIVPLTIGREYVLAHKHITQGTGRAGSDEMPIMPKIIDTMYIANDRYGAQLLKVVITSMQIDKGKQVKTKLTYKPVVCVVFDRGTSVVSDSYVIYIAQL